MKANAGLPHTEPVLRIENLAVSYFARAGEIPAVSDFSLTLHQNESFGLVGESGCGKSTIAMAIMRYLGANGSIVRGRILFEGVDMADMSTEELRQVRGSSLAMVYQQPMSALNPVLTIGLQLMEVPRFHNGASKKEARERARQILRDVRLPDPDMIMDRYPHQLSGGQQQRVVVAMALLANPSLLLLDEPTTALDVTVAAAVVDLIAELREKFNTSLLYISHNLGMISKVCDRVGVMYSGELVEEGTVREVFKYSKHPYTKGLLACIPRLNADKKVHELKAIRGHVSPPQNRPAGCVFGPRCDHFVSGRCDSSEHIAIELTTDNSRHEVRCLRWREIDGEGPILAKKHIPAEARSAFAPTLLRIAELDKFYKQQAVPLLSLVRSGVKKHVKANEDLNFEVKAGEIVGIVGESGCGKSTLAKVLTGLETATAGTAEFQGRNIANTPVGRRSRDLIRALQIVFQDPDGTLNPHHSVGHSIMRALYKLTGERDKIALWHKVRDLLDLVGLSQDQAKRKPHQLSGGQKQRIAIARAFAGSPSLVIADEPVSALDVSVQAAVMKLLLDVQRQYNTSLLFISHDLCLVSYLCDYVVVMYLGQIMEAGPIQALLRPPYHPYTEALLSAVPVPDPDIRQDRIRLETDLPSFAEPPKGCRFAGRCPYKLGLICDHEEPPEVIAGNNHRIKCHIPLEELRKRPPIFGQLGSPRFPLLATRRD